MFTTICLDMYIWPLNESQFTILDRIKIAAFFLNSRERWTMDDQVRAFELEMSKFIGCRYSTFVSSGSTANTIIASYLKDRTAIRKIIFPSTTWTTSVSPFVREGIAPIFCDVNLDDFSLDLDAAERLLKNDASIKAIFITSLLGLVPDIARLIEIEKAYRIRVIMDNCENTFGTFMGNNCSSYFTSTTSTYFGHQLQSVEGGFIFTNDESEYEYFLMARNHGMTRSVTTHNKNKYVNLGVSEKFDFHLLGNNFRNSDIHALIGRLDLSKANKYIKKRVSLFNLFYELIDRNKFILPKGRTDSSHVAFCIPIVSKTNIGIEKYINACENKGIETRPIISGNLLRQTCYKEYGSFSDFPNSEHLHENGFYVGLHPKTTESQIKNLTSFLNKNI